jgi:hypothetical protein
MAIYFKESNGHSASASKAWKKWGDLNMNENMPTG